MVRGQIVKKRGLGPQKDKSEEGQNFNKNGAEMNNPMKRIFMCVTKS